jgi:hypothetical protein
VQGECRGHINNCPEKNSYGQLNLQGISDFCNKATENRKENLERSLRSALGLDLKDAIQLPSGLFPPPHCIVCMETVRKKKKFYIYFFFYFRGPAWSTTVVVGRTAPKFHKTAPKF